MGRHSQKDKDDDANNGRYNNLTKENRQRLGVATDAPSSGAVLNQSAGIPIAIMYSSGRRGT